MGRASSNKKRVRAARAAGPTRQSRSYAWPFAIGSVVVVGVALILVSIGNGSDERLPPRVGDHWHAAYSVYDCERLVAPFPDSMARSDSGIHTHADGLIHLEVNSSRFTGPNANVGAFASGVDLVVADDTLKGPGVTRREGDRCGEEPGTIRLAVWDGPGDESPTVITEDITSYAPQDGQLVTLAFAPEGSAIPKPPPSAISQLGSQATPPPTAAPDSTTSSTSPTNSSTSGDGSTSSTESAELPGSTAPSTTP